MNKKPKFWDFYRAYRQSKISEDLLYVYERKRGKLALYKKLPLKERRKWRNGTIISALAVYLAIVIPPFILELLHIILWSGICFDLIFLGWLLQYILIIIGHKLLHLAMSFEKVSEIDWNNEKESVYKRSISHRKVLNIFNAVLFSFLFLMNSFSLTYLRYLSEGERQAGSASVFIRTYGDFINLDEETPSGKVFSIKNRQGSLIEISIHTIKIPEQVKLYINGTESEFIIGNDTDVFSFSHSFWSRDYFSIDMYGSVYSNLNEGENTLELRSANFSKSWMFNIEYE